MPQRGRLLFTSGNLPGDGVDKENVNKPRVINISIKREVKLTKIQRFIDDET